MTLRNGQSTTIAKWPLALALSGALHAAAFSYFQPQADATQIAGGSLGEVAVLGNAFIDAASAGVESDIVNPVAETQEEALPPPQPTRNIRATAEPLQRASQSVSIPVEQAAFEERSASDTATAAIPERSEAAQSSQVATSAHEAVEPVEMTPQEEELAALDRVPIPSPRPDHVPPQRRQGEPQIQPEPAREQPAQQQQGSRGTAEADARQGESKGVESATQTSSGEGNSTQAGNAAVSNYPGQIVSRLRRSLQYPAQARRQRLTGEVQVSFVVGHDGSVSNIGVVASSGSQILDQAALDTVRRAAPFPALPEGRGSWPFTVPLAFAR